MLVLVDADPIVYTAGFAAERTVAPGAKVVGPKSHALECVNKMCGAMQHKIASAHDEECEFRYFLTGKKNFRNAIATIKPYKGNRDPDAKPYWYKEIRKHLCYKYDATIVENWEADDAVSMLHYSYEPGNTIIATIDKDLKMVPGRNFNYRTGKWHDVDAASARRAFWTQVLTGDTTDNIGGCYKIGKQRAAKLLAGLDDSSTALEFYGVALDAYTSSIVEYGPATGYEHLGACAALLENARLLWMLEYPGQLWTPPGIPDERFSYE